MSTAPNGVGELCIPLDALLDTRLATVAKVKGSEAALAALKAGYRDQLADVFPGIMEDAEFRDAYAQRDVDTLKHAFPTQWLFAVGEIMGSLHEQTVVRPYFSDFKLAINVWPYRLDDAARLAIRRAVQYWTGPHTDVRLVHISPMDMTPQLVLQSFVCLVDYDPYTWLNAQAEAFKAVRCPQVTLISPAIYHQAPPSEQTLAEIDPRVGSPFASMLFLTKPLVDLVLVKPHLFRMVTQTPSALTSPPPASESERSAQSVNPPTA